MLRYKIFAAVGLCVFGLSGCMQPQPGAYPGGYQQDPNRTAIGAGVGAVTGAVIGSVVNDDNRKAGAVIGGIAGAAVGGLVGNRLDQQAQQLQQSMAGTGVVVERQADRINLVFPGDVTFATNSADIQTQFYGPLSNLANSLRQYPDSQVYVIGHTDNVGSYDYNLQLSNLRANSVATFLANSGVSMNRLFTAGKSYSQPKADNATPQGRAANRRVEIQIIPTGQTTQGYGTQGYGTQGYGAPSYNTVPAYGGYTQ